MSKSIVVFDDSPGQRYIDQVKESGNMGTGGGRIEIEKL